MLFVENVIPALNTCVEEGQPVALVTLINIDGSSPRPAGSQLGVAADGRCFGMITGGCAEKAIVSEALQCIETRENKTLRYGAGSPYLDVVLPCGSGIDLYIETQTSADLVLSVHEAQTNRKMAFLLIDRHELSSRLIDALAEADSTHFVKAYEPDYRIFVFGEGTNLVAFCMLARASGIAVKAHSPDEQTLEFLQQQEIAVAAMHRETKFSALPIDNYSAIVTLFHEHEWEANILHAALNSHADYIGALGSSATHRARLDHLSTLPPTKRAANIIRGPVGLDIGAQSPNEIAVSVIAEIIAHRRDKTT